jgi:hypothetical protein
MKLRSALWFALSGRVASYLAAATAAPATAAATYTMTDLGSLGYGVSRGFGINAAGEVAGQSYTNKTVQFPCSSRAAGTFAPRISPTRSAGSPTR